MNLKLSLRSTRRLAWFRPVWLSLTLALSLSSSALTFAGTATARHLPVSKTLIAGVASSASQFKSWNEAFGGRARIRMVFQAWAFAPNPATVLEGPGIPMISWEPWKPPTPGLSARDQGRALPACSGPVTHNARPNARPSATAARPAASAIASERHARPPSPSCAERWDSSIQVEKVV